MTTLAEHIRFLLGLFENRTPTQEECEELGKLLGSREEFVAHVLLRRPVFKTPMVVAALAKLQSGAPAISAPSTREVFGQEALQKGCDDFAATIAKMIEQDAASKPVADAVAATLRDIAVAKPNPLTRLSDRFVIG